MPLLPLIPYFFQSLPPFEVFLFSTYFRDIALGKLTVPPWPGLGLPVYIDGLRPWMRCGCGCGCRRGGGCVDIHGCAAGVGLLAEADRAQLGSDGRGWGGCRGGIGHCQVYLRGNGKGPSNGSPVPPQGLLLDAALPSLYFPKKKFYGLPEVNPICHSGIAEYATKSPFGEGHSHKKNLGGSCSERFQWFQHTHSPILCASPLQDKKEHGKAKVTEMLRVGSLKLGHGYGVSETIVAGRVGAGG